MPRTPNNPRALEGAEKCQADRSLPVAPLSATLYLKQFTVPGPEGTPTGSGKQGHFFSSLFSPCASLFREEAPSLIADVARFAFRRRQNRRMRIPTASRFRVAMPLRE